LRKEIIAKNNVFAACIQQFFGATHTWGMRDVACKDLPGVSTLEHGVGFSVDGLA
jgi:hypothetical protein